MDYKIESVHDIRSHIFNRISFTMFFLAIVVFFIVFFPLYWNNQKKNETELEYKLNSRQLLVEQFFTRARDLTYQITSRSKMKSDLHDYTAGKISLAALAESTRPNMLDAMNQTDDILGITRIDSVKKVIVSVGMGLADEAITSLVFDDDKAVLQIQDELLNDQYVVFVAPIHFDKRSTLGYDIVIFKTLPLKQIIQSYDFFGKNGEVVLYKRTGKSYVPVFPLRNGRRDSIKGKPHAGFSDDIVKSVFLENDELLILIRYNRWDLNRGLNQVSIYLVILSFFIVVLGAQILKKSITPLFYHIDKRNNRILELLSIDSLTSLPNRNQLKIDKESRINSGLIIFNINGFNHINDFYGNSAGDYILQSLAEKISTELKKFQNVKLYRIGGDDFAILAFDCNDKLLEHITQDILLQVESSKFVYNDLTIPVTLNAGISTEHPLIEKADLALKQAKKTVNKKYLLYSSGLNLYDKIRHNYEIIDMVERALEENRVNPYFQAIFHTKDRSLSHYEALVRIEQQNGEVVLPGVFLEVIKNTELYAEITKTVLMKSFKALNKGQGFSVNISMNDIMNPVTTEFMETILKQHRSGAEGSAFIIEILETEKIENYEIMENFIKKFKKEYNCQIAIDDFGAGYSSYNHILQMDVDFIKIDASLVQNMHSNKNAYSIVQNIVKISKDLNTRTIAEFVHSREVYDAAVSLDVDLVQGYYLHQPSPWQNI